MCNFRKGKCIMKRTFHSSRRHIAFSLGNSAVLQTAKSSEFMAQLPNYNYLLGKKGSFIRFQHLYMAEDKIQGNRG